MIGTIDKKFVFEYNNADDLAISLSIYKKNNLLLLIVDKSDTIKGILIENQWKFDPTNFIKSDVDYRLYGCYYAYEAKNLNYNSHLPSGLDWNISGVSFKVYNEARVPINIS